VKPIRSFVAVAAGLLMGGAALAQSIVVASTTSTEQSGLFGSILPQFKQATGIEVKVVALGTGQAIDMARRGDADVLFVHDKVAEEKFVAEGARRSCTTTSCWWAPRPTRPRPRARTSWPR
jgi:tungstate transport system substrate-binding protein